jgi:hypothetical protein
MISSFSKSCGIEFPSGITLKVVSPKELNQIKKPWPSPFTSIHHQVDIFEE